MQPAVPGRLLGGRYRLLDFLARGGMASVWTGEDTLLALRVGTVAPLAAAAGVLTVTLVAAHTFTNARAAWAR